MAKVVTGKALARAKRDYAKTQTQEPLEFILGIIRTVQKDVRDFPRRRSEHLKSCAVNITIGLRNKQSARQSAENLACVLAFMAVYGRAPHAHEVKDLDIDEMIVYFNAKYPDDIFGED